MQNDTINLKKDKHLVKNITHYLNVDTYYTPPVSRLQLLYRRFDMQHPLDSIRKRKPPYIFDLCGRPNLFQVPGRYAPIESWGRSDLNWRISFLLYLKMTNLQLVYKKHNNSNALAGKETGHLEKCIKSLLKM